MTGVFTFADRADRQLMAGLGLLLTATLAAAVLVFTETGRPEGTGLGLSTVRETAKPHAGGVRLTPSPSGTRFGLSMPWQPS